MDFDTYCSPPSTVLGAEGPRTSLAASARATEGDGLREKESAAMPEELWGPEDDIDDLIAAINSNFVAEVRASLDHSHLHPMAYPA